VILDRERVERYLALARALGRTQVLHDVHVSPYEVIFGGLEYRPDAEVAGVLGLEGARYTAQRPGPLRIDDAAASDRLLGQAEVPTALSRALLRRQYAHLGPRVLADGMALCGIGRSLLIPVVRPGADPAEQVRLTCDLYGADERFRLAWCPRLPAGEAEILAEVRGALARWPIRALKLNANIQGLDLATGEGRAALGHLVAACRATALPLIVHGGISRLLQDPRGRAFAALHNLADVAWRETGTPVVLCHAGLFGCPSGAVEALLPTLARMLADHDNLLVDVSGLSFTALCAVLRRFDPTRVVFGSDALYFPQWSAVVKVLFALDELGLPVAETFGMLAGTNPARLFPGEVR
jgi:hypothetical protein